MIFIQGVFVYKGSYKIGKKKKKVKCPAYLNEPWYIAYNETWGYIEQAAEVQIHRVFRASHKSQSKEYLTEYINISECQIENVPTSYFQFGVFRVENKSDSIECIVPRNSHGYFVNR